jgi:hypothetical protein
MYDREIELKTKFNKTVISLLGISDKDYYSVLRTDQILTLKSALSDINNLITLHLTLSLAGWICNKFDIPEETRKTVLDKVRSAKPNTNGYDIELSDPYIIAEIKCNIPINGGQVYGSAQRNGLQKDIVGLLAGKKKNSRNTDNAFKFLGLYDTPEVRKATEHFVKNLPENLNQKLFIEPTDGVTFDNQYVYIVFVK